MTVTNVLQEQAGIQYGSVTDKSEADPRDSMNNVLFTGEFKRGRFDQPMKVLASSIRAVLGYDPDNMTYVAIEDALAAGAPFVWVQRVLGALICQKLINVDRKRQFIVGPDLAEGSSQQKIDAGFNALIESGVFTINGNSYRLKDTNLFTQTNEYLELRISATHAVEFHEVEFCASAPFIFEARDT